MIAQVLNDVTVDRGGKVNQNGSPSVFIIAHVFNDGTVDIQGARKI